MKRIVKFFKDHFKDRSIVLFVFYVILMTTISTIILCRLFKLNVMPVLIIGLFIHILGYFCICYIRENMDWGRDSSESIPWGLEMDLNRLYLENKISKNEMLREYKIATGDFALYRFFRYFRGFLALTFDRL